MDLGLKAVRLGASPALFEERFGEPGGFTVHAPGRVNLIGEHIDYSLLPVLPMAIQLGIGMTVRARKESRLCIVNADSRFADVQVELSRDGEPGGPGGWAVYARGVAQTLVREYAITVGADILVESDLPVAAGLSSSSALSCGVALALLAANGLDVDRVELAELVARAEQYTGTEGGGMDQAVILCARKGHALGVKFAPLTVRHRKVPEDWVFLVAHSGVVAEKSGAAQAIYNARTHECRDALQAMWAALGGKSREDHNSRPTPDRDYRPLFESWKTNHLLRVGEEVLGSTQLARFRHTVTEAQRVSEAGRALGNGDMDSFGSIMDASHESLRGDYQVSTPELDRIVGLARQAGAAGARLTGAGLGGAALILCTEAAAPAVREALESGYYAARVDPSAEGSVFRVIASDGANVRTVPTAP